MSFASLAKTVEQYAVNNSPALLTAAGVVGTTVTAVFAARAHVQATDIIRTHQALAGVPQTKKERAKQAAPLVWKCYIPPVVAGTATITAIIASNRIGSKRAAASLAAYSISEKAYSEYRDKVVEKFGEGKERQVRDEIAQDRVNRTKDDAPIILGGTGDTLFYDSYSGRYWETSVTKIDRAVNETNYQSMHEGYASVSDFYERVGLPKTDGSDDLGWTSDKLLEVEYSTTIFNEERACMVVSFKVMPIRDFHRLI